MLPSLRGHGASMEPAFGYSVLDYVADIHRLIAFMQKPFHIIGYSHGALIGAVASIVFPSTTVLSLVSIDESFSAHPDRMIWDRWSEARHLRWFFDWEHLYDRLTVPALFFLAEQSHMVTSSEDQRLMLKQRENFIVQRIPGTHASCLDHVTLLNGRITSFYHDIISTNEESKTNAGRK